MCLFHQSLFLQKRFVVQVLEKDILQRADSLNLLLKDLIVESAAPYFVDQRSVEDVVKQIQSRAFLYVNEQR